MEMNGQRFWTSSLLLPLTSLSVSASISFSSALTCYDAAGVCFDGWKRHRCGFTSRLSGAMELLTAHSSAGDHNCPKWRCCSDHLFSMRQGQELVTKGREETGENVRAERWTYTHSWKQQRHLHYNTMTLTTNNSKRGQVRTILGIFMYTNLKCYWSSSMHN